MFNQINPVMKKLFFLLLSVIFIGISCNSQYQYKKEIQDGLFLTKVDGKFGLINNNGNILIHNEYDTLDFCGSKGYSVKNGKIGLIDREGNILIPNEYEKIDWYGNLGVSVKDGKYGIIDIKGKIIIPNEYELIEFVKDRFKFTKEGEIKIISFQDYLGKYQ